MEETTQLSVRGIRKEEEESRENTVPVKRKQNLCNWQQMPKILNHFPGIKLQATNPAYYLSES